MIVKLLTERHLEFLSLKGGCTGSSESTLVKMSNCWKSHALAQMINCQKFNFLPFSTINSVTTRVRDLNGTSQISLVTHDAKGEM